MEPCVFSKARCEMFNSNDQYSDIQVCIEVPPEMLWDIYRPDMPYFSVTPIYTGGKFNVIFWKYT